MSLRAPDAVHDRSFWRRSAGPPRQVHWSLWVPFPRRRMVWIAERGGCFVADPVPWLYCSGQLGVGQQAALVEFLGVEAGGHGILAAGLASCQSWWRLVVRRARSPLGGYSRVRSSPAVPPGVSMITSAACSRSAGASSLRTAIRAVLIPRVASWSRAREAARSPRSSPR
jgi:hypothetical protein